MLLDIAGFTLIAEVLFLIILLAWSSWRHDDIYPKLITSVVCLLIGLDWFDYFSGTSNVFTGLAITLMFLGGFIFLHMIYKLIRRDG